MTNIKNYYLDTKSIFKIKSEETRRVYLDLYYQMISFFNNKDLEAFECVFNTLDHSGYLLNINTKNRENKINEIIDE